MSLICLVAAGRGASADDGPRPAAVVSPDLTFSTYLGRARDDVIEAVAVDAAGYVYVAGSTYSTDLPVTPGALQPQAAGSSDVFVAKLTPDGSRIVYLTYLGGSDFDQAHAIAVDSTGAVHVAGETRSLDFPTTARAFQRQRAGGETFFPDAFAAKIDPAGATLIYSTYLGGRNEDRARAIAVDAGGAVYLAGETRSTEFPTTATAYDRTLEGVSDAFVAKLAVNGDALVYGTYLGAEGWDAGAAIDVDAVGAVSVGGTTMSNRFPTTPGALQRVYGGGYTDGFLTRLNPAGTGLVYSTLLGGTYDEFVQDLLVDGAGRVYATGYTTSRNFPVTLGSVQPTFQGEIDAFVVQLNPTGSALGFGTYLGGVDVDWGTGIALDAQGFVYLSGYTHSANFPTTLGAVQPIFFPSWHDAFVAVLGPTGNRVVYGTFLGGDADDRALGLALGPGGQVTVAGYSQSSNFPISAGALQTAPGGAPYPIDGFITRLKPPLPAVAVEPGRSVYLPLVGRGRPLPGW